MTCRYSNVAASHFLENQKFYWFEDQTSTMMV